MKKSLHLLFLFAFLHLSSNLSAQWQPCNSGLIEAYCLMSTSGKILAGTSIGTFASIDNGLTWSASNTGMSSSPNAFIYSLGENSAGIFAGANQTIYFSNDNGLSWSIVDSSSYRTKCFAFLGDTAFAATLGGGILMSPDNGLTWTQMNNGITTDSIYSIVTKGHQLFAGTHGKGVFVSSNSGINWTNVSNGLQLQTNINCLKTDGTNLYAGTIYNIPDYTSYGMFISSNNGASWTHVNNTLDSSAIYDILCVGNVVLASNGIVYRSADQGITWSLFDDNIDYIGCGTHGYVDCFSASPNYVYCGTSGGCPNIYHRDINQALSVNDIQSNNPSFTLYPNPTQSTINIDYNPAYGEVSLDIYNLMGALIKTYTLNSSHNNINIAFLAKGMYFIKIKNQQSVKCLKFEKI